MKPAPRKRIAVLGGGAHTIPSYRRLLQRLSRENDIVVFSEFFLPSQSHVPEYKLKCVPTLRFHRVQKLLFFLMVFLNNARRRFDIIHSHSTYPSGFTAIICGWIFRTPVLVCLDAAETIGIKDIGFGDGLFQRKLKINQWVIRKATAITVLTRFQLEGLTPDEARTKARVIPRGIDASFASSGKDHEPGDPIRFLNVGYIHPVKDQETALRAFQIIQRQRPATITFVGQDYENGRLQHLAHDLGINDHVTWRGFVPHPEMRPVYESADVLLHTSRYESQGLAALEAMAMGVLVCGTHVGLLADLSNECCTTVPVRDHEALAALVIELLNNPQERERLRTNARKWTEQYSLEWTANQYEQLYQELVQN
ncbi:MAG: glycosyltransferase family 4 protein [Cyclobacteriaceae bacterium]|nr:glycosyltransferase family 4 protein [Cyclobacteriaceae bacterium]